VVALLNAGAFFGSIIPAVVSKWIGRRYLLAMAGFFFLIGGILQTAAQTPSLSMIYAGRVLAGFGVGMISNTAPVFVAECSPKHLRGIMMGAFEMFLVSGGMLAYWSVYGCSLHMKPTSKQWRTPLSLQIILAILVMVGALVACESPRWLAKQGNWDAAIKSLCNLRGSKEDDPEIVKEMAEIRAQIEEELALTNGRSIQEMFTKKNLQRLLWGMTVALFAMWCGHNAILVSRSSSFGPVLILSVLWTISLQADRVHQPEFFASR
jgi:MFS family permease